jgi:hypothetical protein
MNEACGGDDSQRGKHYGEKPVGPFSRVLVLGEFPGGAARSHEAGEIMPCLDQSG